jgi:hypothetical protein
MTVADPEGLIPGWTSYKVNGKIALYKFLLIDLEAEMANRAQA